MMTESNWLSMAGAIMDIIGAVLLFKYGIPSDYYCRKRDKKELEYDNIYHPEKAERDKMLQEFLNDTSTYSGIKDVEHRNNIDVYSRVGLICLIIGFIFQFLAQLPVWTTSNNSTIKGNC